MKNYDFCFGCGFSCGVTQALRSANLQFASLPFDWTATPSFPRAARIAAADFAHWLDREDLELIDVRHSGINRRIYFNRRTGFGFVHDFSLFKSPDDAYAEVAAKYERRAERFRKCVEASRKVLAVCVEWPILGRLRDETLDETRRVFETRFPGVAFDLLYFHVAEGAKAAKVESERPGVTVVGCEYRKYFENGELHHEIDNSQILDFLKDNYSAPDPRSEEEKSRYAAEWRRQDRERWHGKGAFDTMVNRSAFRLYRKLERFLARKGLAPQEHAMWFGLENEPR